MYKRGSLLDGLALYLSCDTKKFHDNESTHILHNFWTSAHRGKLPHPPPLAAPQTSTDIIVPIYLHLKLHYGFHCYSADLPVAVSPPSIVMKVGGVAQW